MRLYPSDRWPLPLPAGHRFPAAKYAALRRRLEDLAAGGAAFEFVDPHAATDDELLRVHDRGYVGRVLSGTLSREEVRRIGFPWSPELVARSLRSTGAAIDAAAAALADGVAASLAGGTHHAGTDWGEGWCVFNDTAVAARELQARGAVRRVLILDCDVHQGNGTAQIFAADENVFTMSIHGARNFPLRKHASSLDVPLDDGTGDDAYLAALSAALSTSIARARADLVLYIAGADPYVGDRLGRLALTKAGLVERDRLVLAAAARAGLPVGIVCGGGYSADVAEIVDIHAATMLLAAGRPQILERPRGSVLRPKDRRPRP
jgi:acetoin utilization deacetylase AcuC-like enzyme